MSIGQGKLLSKRNTRYTSVAKNCQMSQYLFIAILCAEMSRVNWAYTH